MSVHRLRKIDGPNNTPVKEKVDQILMMENIVESENSGINIIEEVKKKRGRPRKLVKKCYVKTGKKRGRPSSYNAKIASRIFKQLARGRSITEICGDENMPCLKTVFNWLDKKNPAFQKIFLSSYSNARMLQLHLLGDTMLEIALDGSDDCKIIEKRNN
jgi:hypothetical protein